LESLEKKRQFIWTIDCLRMINGVLKFGRKYCLLSCGVLTNTYI